MESIDVLGRKLDGKMKGREKKAVEEGKELEEKVRKSHSWMMKRKGEKGRKLREREPSLKRYFQFRNGYFVNQRLI